MENYFIFLFAICVFLNQAFAEERKGYILLVPRVLGRKSKNELQLHRFNLDCPGKVTVGLRRTSNDSIYVEEDFDIEAGSSRSFLNFEVPDIEEYQAKIQIKGKFKQENDDDYEIFGEDHVNFKTPVKRYVFIQTDKAIYKPGQKVQIRVLAMDISLRPFGKNRQLSMWINEPISNSRVAQWKNISIGAGLIQREFLLSNEPSLGSWKITTLIDDDAQDVARFTVKEYVLPKFEVTITPPSYVLITSETFSVKICGRYTYGKPVEGNVKLNVTLQTYSWSREKFPTLSHDGPIDGCYSHEINVSRLDENFSNVYRSISVFARIDESATGISRNASILISRISNPLNLRHETASKQYFKPGLPYYGLVKVTKPDNTEASDEPVQICATVSRERVLSGWWATRSVQYCRNYTSNGEGLISYTVPPQNTDVVSINIEAKSVRNYTSPKKNRPTLYPPQASVYLRPYFSPSGSFIQIQTIRESLSCGKLVSIPLLYTAKNEGSYKFYYQVVSSSKILQNGFVVDDFTEADDISEDAREDSITLHAKKTQLNPPRSSTESEGDDETNDDNNCKAIRNTKYVPMLGLVNIDIDITAAESPYFRFLVYRIRDDREVVTDSQKLTVEKCFDNKVNLEFGDEVKQPGTKTSLQLKSSPFSLCGIKVIDKSVALLDSNEQLTIKKVFEAVQRADNNQYYPRNHCNQKKIQPGLERRKLDVSIIRPPRPWVPSSSYEDAITAVELSGYLAISDLILLTRPCRPNVNVHYARSGRKYGAKGMKSVKRGKGSYRRSRPQSLTADAMSEDANTATESVVAVRTEFPETWLFDLINVGQEGKYVEKVRLPHTITEWLGSAVCINEQDGLGLTAKDATIKGFQAFFVSFTLPYSVIRGEKLSVVVTVFNYLDKCLPVTLTFEQSGGFKFLSDSSEVDLCVCGGKSVSGKFIIEPTVLNTLNLTASAKNSENPGVCGDREVADVVARDAATNQLLVEAEGFKYEKSTNVLFCPSESDGGSFKQAFQYELPQDDVEDSGRGYFSASGDIMGSSIENLDRLVRLPTGCGEQNMVTFSPIVSVLDYLTATKQLREKLKVKAQRFLTSGYQRQLKYRHKDGSFSTFGDRDKSGSTFLTAFVLRSFAQAKKYIDIEGNIMKSATEWLVSRQRPDGSFPEIGATLSHGIKGGLNSSSTSLTAYVVSSLIVAGNDNKTVIDAALTYITSEKEVNNPYQAALFAYTFALAGQKSRAMEYVKRALNRAETTDNEIKWKIGGSTTNSVSLETAAYTLLTLTKLGVSRENSLAIVKAITKSRNSYGGFYSTQDTILVLEALSKFAAGLNGEVNLKLTVCGGINEKLKFTEDDKLQVRKLKTNEVPTTLEVEATGSGCGLMQATVLCNTKNPPKQEVFDLKIKAAKSSNCKTASIKVCTRYIPKGKKSNMALVEIKMVSGMAADKESLQTLLRDRRLNLKRYEVNNNNLVFYFDELTNDETCFEFQATEICEVQDAKPATAQVYDYYAIEKQQKATYGIDGQSCKL